MNQHAISRKHSKTLQYWTITGIALLGIMCAATLPLQAQVRKESKDQSDAGLMLSVHATAKEVGLPIYPGERPHKDEGENSQAVQLRLEKPLGEKPPEATPHPMRLHPNEGDH